MEANREFPLALQKAPASKVSQFRAAMAAAGARRKAKAGQQQQGQQKQQQQQQKQQEEGASSSKREAASPTAAKAAQGDAVDKENQDSAAAAATTAGAALTCCSCGVEASSLLLQQCQHLLCLSCAAERLQQQIQHDPLSPYNRLLCPCCRKETLLPDDTTATLVRMQPRHKHRKSHANKAAAAPAAAAPPAAVNGEGTYVRAGEVFPPPAAGAAAGAAAAAAAAAATNGTPIDSSLLCCCCKKQKAILSCAACVNIYCKTCAVDAHATQAAAGEAAANLSLHRFSPLICPSVSSSDRYKLREIDHYRRLGDADPFLEVAEGLSAAAAAAAAGTATGRGAGGAGDLDGLFYGGNILFGDRKEKDEETGEGGDKRSVSLEEIVNSHIPLNATPRLCSVSSVACELHAGEPCQFYCCTCGGPCVCGECIISGPHQRHSIVSVETAWQEALGKIDVELHAIIERTEEDVRGAQAVLRDSQTEWASSLAQDKQLLSLTFFQIKRQLEEKQKETVETLQGFVDSFAAECDAFRSLINNKIKLIEDKCAAVSLRKGALDPQLLLSYLGGDEFIQTQQLIDTDIPQMFKHLPDSRNALLEHMQQTTDDLLSHLTALRGKIQHTQH